MRFNPRVLEEALGPLVPNHQVRVRLEPETLDLQIRVSRSRARTDLRLDQFELGSVNYPLDLIAEHVRVMANEVDAFLVDNGAVFETRTAPAPEREPLTLDTLRDAIHRVDAVEGGVRAELAAEMARDLDRRMLDAIVQDEMPEPVVHYLNFDRGPEWPKTKDGWTLAPGWSPVTA